MSATVPKDIVTKGGYKLSDFIRIFKAKYGMKDGRTYDFMSLLEVVDPASYITLIVHFGTPNNANAVINSQIGVALHNISTRSRSHTRKSGQRGGAFLREQAFVFILVLFILTLQSAIAGPAYERLVSEYGKDNERWPRHPGDKPKAPVGQLGLFYGRWEPTKEAIAVYEEMLSYWEQDSREYSRFSKLYDSYKYEHTVEEEEKLELAKQKHEEKIMEEETRKIEAQTKLKVADESLVRSNIAKEVTSQVTDLINLYVHTAAEKEELLKRQHSAEMQLIMAQAEKNEAWYKAFATGGFAVFFILTFFNSRNRIRRVLFDTTPEHDRDVAELTRGIEQISMRPATRLGLPTGRELPYRRGGAKKHSRKVHSKK